MTQMHITAALLIGILRILHPLKYVLGLANAAQQLGVQIFEQSLVTQVKHEPHKIQVITEHGSVSCDHVVYACNGYLGDLEPNLAARIMPINNFIVATEPLDSDLDVIPSDNIAVADSKFVVNYFRKSPDNRLLFGGGENYGYQFPKDIAATVRKPMLEIFPQLRDVKIDYAWGNIGHHHSADALFRATVEKQLGRHRVFRPWRGNRHACGSVDCASDSW